MSMLDREIERTTVYIDLDGVLADFDKFAIEQLGQRFDAFPDSRTAWAAMERHGDIYARLDPMPDAHELVSGVFRLKNKYGFKVGVLTAIPKIGRIPNAKHDKKLWLVEYFPELVSTFNIGPHAEHKQYHCRVNDVLIDDSERNIPQWNERGGYGILHTSAEKSLKDLAKYFENVTDVL